jgi:hypothetical protein
MMRSLADADNIVNGQRQDQYGKPEDSFSKIASYWQIYLMNKMGDSGEIYLEELDVVHMMTLLKIARMQGQGECRDNYIDAIGYLAIGADRLL